MDANDPVVRTFTTRMRQLILRYKELQQENVSLRQQLDSRGEELRLAHDQMAQLQRDYDSLKLARMLAVSGMDIDAAKTRISKTIRDINRCIAYLNDIGQERPT